MKKAIIGWREADDLFLKPGGVVGRVEKKINIRRVVGSGHDNSFTLISRPVDKINQLLPTGAPILGPQGREFAKIKIGKSE